MNMKRNYAALILVICILAATLAGCVKPANAPSETKKNRLEQIIDRGYMEVAIDPYFAPMEFIDPSKTGDDKYVGCDIEFAKYIADKLGVELRIKPLEFGAVLAGVTEGKYDMAISALAYTPLRAETMNLSKGYYFDKNNAGHGLLIREEDAEKIKGAQDVAGKTIVVQDGSLQALFVEEQLEGYKECKRVGATTDGFLSVQEGKADVCVTSIATAELYIKANKDCGLMIVPDFKFIQDEETLGTRIGMPKGEDELTARMNEIIQEVIDSGAYEQWYSEYVAYAESLGIE